MNELTVVTEKEIKVERLINLHHVLNASTEWESTEENPTGVTEKQIEESFADIDTLILDEITDWNVGNDVLQEAITELLFAENDQIAVISMDKPTDEMMLASNQRLAEAWECFFSEFKGHMKDKRDRRQSIVDSVLKVVQ